MYRLKFKQLFKTVNFTYVIREFFVGSTSYMIKIDKILIANRGEIACRIIRTAKELGIKTVTIFSDIDKNSMHVESADEAYFIGPAPSSHSYLRQDKIITIAKRAKCQAVHPGYGFLSENAEFSELCQKENIIFIGPPAEAIRDMGIKSTSKDIMLKAGVPTIDGYHEADQSNQTLLEEAKKIGFPLMIKATRGGGGKGMRIVLKETEFLEALESARTESLKSFGDTSVLLERYISEPRHVEVQIFADKHDNIVYLFERDCSVQRRHQKVIEEAPAPGISAELRKKLGLVAIQAARAVGYVGAGTVEFIMDKHTQKFYFMEMNTRLQVEHPVTEAITGTDLVEWQIKIATGEKLPLKQEDIQLNGHAFEARIYAENPEEGFLPAAGKLVHVTLPSINKNVRVETGVRQNDEVTVHYDPMIAKLVVWGKDRNEALNILQSKLSEYSILGLETNIEFIKNVCSNPKFQNGDVHTGFIKENYGTLFPKIQVPDRILIEGVIGFVLHEEMNSFKFTFNTDNLFNPFFIETGLRLNHLLNRRIFFEVEEKKFFVDVQYSEAEVYYIRINDVGPWRKVSGILKYEDNIFTLLTNIEDVVRKSRIVQMKNEIHLFTQERKWHFIVSPPKYIKKLNSVSNLASGSIVSPMPGVVDKIFVKKGDAIKVGDPLLVIIAMKMEHSIKASESGIVEKVFCEVGENLAKNKPLIKFSHNTL